MGNIYHSTSGQSQVLPEACRFVFSPDFTGWMDGWMDSSDYLMKNIWLLTSHPVILRILGFWTTSHLVGKSIIPGDPNLSPNITGFFTPFLLSALSPCREPDLHSVSGSTKSEISRSENYRMDQTITTNKTGKTRLTWNALTPRTDVAFTVTTPRTLEVPLNTSVCMKIIP